MNMSCHMQAQIASLSSGLGMPLGVTQSSSSLKMSPSRRDSPRSAMLLSSACTDIGSPTILPDGSRHEKAAVLQMRKKQLMWWTRVTRECYPSSVIDLRT